jgi:hypothetical protein
MPFRFFVGARFWGCDRRTGASPAVQPLRGWSVFSGIQPGVASHPGLRLLNPSGVGMDPVERIPSSRMDSFMGRMDWGERVTDSDGLGSVARS